MSGPGQFRFDPALCCGCEACVLACRLEHGPAQALPWRRVYTFNATHFPHLPVFHLSLGCGHCRHPVCLELCPAGAYRADPDTGVVVHLAERCMGCRLCALACPLEAPRFDPARGTAEKCGFCADRQKRGLEPACAAWCPVGALGFEPRPGVAAAGYGNGALPGFPPSPLGPAIRIVKGLRPPPLTTAPPQRGLLERCRRGLAQVPEPRITAQGECSLVAFTTLLALLVAVTAAWAAGAAPPPQPWPLLWTGALCLSLAFWHLGRPLRAWRALGNLRRSWLSREAALVLGFLMLAALGALAPSRVLGWAAATIGFAVLFAVDRVYQAALRTSRLDFHSAHALSTGLYLIGLLAGSWQLALGAGALKAALYLHRKFHFRRRGRNVRPALSLARLALGFVVPALAFGGWPAVLAAVLGDLVDRWEFYGELEVPSPAGQMARDLEAMV